MDQIQQDMIVYKKRLDNNEPTKRVDTPTEGLEIRTSRSKTYHSSTDTRLESVLQEETGVVEDATLLTVEYKSFTENVLQHLKVYE